MTTVPKVIQAVPATLENLPRRFAAGDPQIRVAKRSANNVSPIGDGLRRKDSLVQARIDMDGQSQFGSERLDALAGAGVGAGDDVVDWFAGQKVG
jgi:molybdopterin/thiamine biosynthesis adenylyltransferase